MKNSKANRIILVEDDALYGKAIKRNLAEAYDVLLAGSAEEARKKLKKVTPEVVLLDISLPGQSGIEFLQEFKSEHAEVPVIMLTAMDDVPKVVESMKLGAYDYLLKPVRTETLIHKIDQALQSAKLQQEVERRRNLQLATNQEYQLIGESASLNKIRKEIQVLGETDTTVLIQGETGTGKELVARHIHAASPRASGPFVALNCGAIPKDLIESELFGHKKGAFTGAEREIGKFRLAAGGTLLLDEISEMPVQAQTRLLRVLEEGEFYPVGSTELVHVDVRTIASTNRKLDERVKKGAFREDLYYRLNVYPLLIPPLREHPDDIIPLAHFFIEQFNIKFGKNFKEITPKAQEILVQHSWKGNVRELRSLIERVLLFQEGEVIEPEHLNLAPAQATSKTETPSFKLPEDGLDLEELERTLILQALERTKYNKTRAAKLLNLSPPTFYYRLEKYGLK
ncbi:sigma-54-dependent Fis family transcriptional regulator [candidate division KSB1 bacterium]|nr:sigma-54-dependent Fis family transcriptional regulator [candidate division KSB1 bacterium]NIR68742.1 sigma-54-dependent Fis family transcriptional regulator [candidate division KSB1 bacterium]NIS25559.1 sigma-54-dependent Fis family transcriptional regulator [candidate division KSB1 bacterium]NIT72453.1 sigma-54-dependent Fis family transcriptional regulator [candidate division KSB1 bacterium]NIU26236.1 sigma-54-dependent Fis family transcriptional regulator [candidate division KSB1 bacteri